MNNFIITTYFVPSHFLNSPLLWLILKLLIYPICMCYKSILSIVIFTLRGLWSSAIEQGPTGKKEVIFQARRVPVDPGTGFRWWSSCERSWSWFRSLGHRRRHSGRRSTFPDRLSCPICHRSRNSGKGRVRPPLTGQPREETV